MSNINSDDAAREMGQDSQTVMPARDQVRWGPAALWEGMGTDWDCGVHSIIMNIISFIYLSPLGALRHQSVVPHSWGCLLLPTPSLLAHQTDDEK